MHLCKHLKLDTNALINPRGARTKNWQCLIKHGLGYCCSALAMASKILLLIRVGIQIWDPGNQQLCHNGVVGPHVADAPARHLVNLKFIILPLFLSPPSPLFSPSPSLFVSASKTHGCGGWNKGRTHSWAKNQDFRWSGLWDCFFSRRIRTVARAFCSPPSLLPPAVVVILSAVCMWSLWLACPVPNLSSVFGIECRHNGELWRSKGTAVCIPKLKLLRLYLGLWAYLSLWWCCQMCSCFCWACWG